MSHVWAEAVAARGLLPETLWRRYELFDFEGMREQGIWEDAAKKLLQSWRKKRPALFGTKTNESKKDSRCTT